MTPRFNLHTHTNYVDGKNTAEEMVKAALFRGFSMLGFSEHAYTGFDPVFSLPKDKIALYCAEVRALAEKYKGQMEIYLGMEMDGLDPQDPAGLDYFIGSMHWLHINGRYYAVDAHKEELRACIDEGFGGRRLCRRESLLRVCREYGPGDPAGYTRALRPDMQTERGQPLF